LSVCSVIPPLTTSMVAGSRAIWPAVKRKPPALTACEYGPIALGASEVAIVFTATTVVLGNCWRNPKYGSSKLTGPPPHRSPVAEHSLRIPGRDPGHFLDIKAAQFREACADHGDTARFVALAPMWNWRQVWRVGLDQEAFHRHRGDGVVVRPVAEGDHSTEGKVPAVLQARFPEHRPAGERVEHH